MILNQRARNLRRRQTDAERRLWRALRDRQMEAFKFRRQYLIAGYIADFACPEQKLIVELDGGQHAQSVQYDLRRTKKLEANGFRVLRFWDNDALINTDAVLETIRLALLDDPSPRPSPLKGERG